MAVANEIAKGPWHCLLGPFSRTTLSKIYVRSPRDVLFGMTLLSNLFDTLSTKAYHRLSMGKLDISKMRWLYYLVLHPLNDQQVAFTMLNSRTALRTVLAEDQPRSSHGPTEATLFRRLTG